MSARVALVAVAIASLSAASAIGQVPPEGKSWIGNAPPGVRDPNLPPAQDAAKQQLASSPRAAEWVEIGMTNAPALESFVVRPERRPRSGSGVVIVVHEAFGLTDWVRGVADQLAKHGFIAIAPDLLSGKGPGGGATDSLGDQAGRVLATLTVDEVVARLDAVREYASKMPGGNGRVASVGFGWGGGMSFTYAMTQPQLRGAVSFYGPIPLDPAAYENARVAILGLYGSADAGITENIPLAEVALGMLFTPQVFLDAGPGFLRQQNGQNGANLKATTWAWPEAVAFLLRSVG